MPKFQAYLDSITDGEQHPEIRIQHMEETEAETNRKLIVYAADFKKGSPYTPPSIEPDDKVGFSDLIEGLEGEPLDILIRSTGGSAEVAEELVGMLRANFESIRFVVPDRAMSAATLMCLAGDSILMDERSFLGPIDPQIEIQSPHGNMRLPAQTVIDGFEEARKAVSEDQKALNVFLPWLTQYGPFVQVCRSAIDLSIELATTWLEKYMLAGQLNAQETAEQIAKYLSDHALHKSHGRPIGIDDARERGLQIVDLRTQPDLRELIHKLWAAIHLYFVRAPSVKLFESAHGVSWARSVVTQDLQIPIPSPFQPPVMPPEIEQPLPKKSKKKSRGKRKRSKKK